LLCGVTKAKILSLLRQTNNDCKTNLVVAYDNEKKNPQDTPTVADSGGYGLG